MKKLCTALLAIAVALLFTGCGAPPGAPDYSADEANLQYDIGMWIGVPQYYKQYDVNGKLVKQTPLTDEEFLAQFTAIREAGINIATAGHGESSEPYALRCLAAGEQVGIRYIVTDNTMRSYFYGLKEKLESGAVTREEAVRYIRTYSEKYTKYSSFAGYLAFDEPSASWFEQLGIAEEVMAEALPGNIFYVNLFPYFTPTSLLGGTYAEYLAGYLENVKTPYISYDHYPLKKDGYGTGFIAEDFLYNMDVVRRAAKDRDLWAFLQSVEYGSANRSMTSKADAGFQAYTLLAYGGKGMQWFCYWSPPPFDGITTFGDAMVDSLGNRTDTYEYVQAVNNEILAFDHIYLNFDWKGVILTEGSRETTGGMGNFDYIRDSAIMPEGVSVSASHDVLTGVFEDDGRKGYMVVNFTDPEAGIKNTVTMKLDGAKGAIVIKNGKQEKVRLSGGKLKFTMQAGEGFFVIPY